MLYFIYLLSICCLVACNVRHISAMHTWRDSLCTSDRFNAGESFYLLPW